MKLNNVIDDSLSFYDIELRKVIKQNREEFNKQKMQEKNRTKTALTNNQSKKNRC